MITVFKPGTAPDPGCCLVCGTVRQYVIGFDVTRPWDGAMLICVVCLKHVLTDFQAPEFDEDGEIAVEKAFDVVAGQKHRNLEKLYKLASGQSDRLRAAQEKFRLAFDDAVATFDTDLRDPELDSSGDLLSALSFTRSESE